MAHHAARKEKLEGYQIANEYAVRKRFGLKIDSFNESMEELPRLS